MKKNSNAEKFPEAWKIFIDCARKWKEKDFSQYPAGWKYGIPDPNNPNEYIYSDCPGKLFTRFRITFYEKTEIYRFRNFLTWLEKLEGK